MSKLIKKIISSVTVSAISLLCATSLTVNASLNTTTGPIVSSFVSGTWNSTRFSDEKILLYSRVSGRFENVRQGNGESITGMFSYNWEQGVRDEGYTKSNYMVYMLSGSRSGFEYPFVYHHDNHISVISDFENSALN